MHQQTIAVVDFGSQYAQLIARRVRENQVFSVLVRPDISVEELRQFDLRGIILSGGPASVYADDAVQCDPSLFELGVPVLGICYGMQVGCQVLGAHVAPAASREYGRTHLRVVQPNALLQHIPAESTVWMSHGDVVNELPDAFMALARTDTCPYAAVTHRDRPFYGVQFHPEVTHTAQGSQILHNFLYDVCGCDSSWQTGNFVDETVTAIRKKVGDRRVICGLSGGVDSSVAAAMVHQAVGPQLTCIFVDNGLLRTNEAEMVATTFRDHFHIDLRVVDASQQFLGKLEGVSDPQEKRRIIGHEFIEVFRETAKDIPDATFLVQGTLYPDVIESGHSLSGKAANIKLHHNVGGLPEELGFDLIEPLRDLFKDEVRRAGQHLGLPDEIVWRHPFPGPGLAVRILGTITPERLEVVRQADDIYLEEIRAANLYRRISQAFAVLIPVGTVGVMGDGRTYEQVIALRAVETTDFMTADWVRIPDEVLATVASRIINEVRGVNRVVYDISTKPPATIEWE